MFDTNVFISGNPYIGMVKAHILCAVVVQELLAGRNAEDQKMLLKAADELERRRLLVVPNKEDWYEVGKCLRKLLTSGQSGGQRFSKEYLSCLVRDALIARCAIRAEAELITSNTVDFDRIKSVFKRLKHRTPSEFFGTRPR
jgi:predicted nucleic acid-binding protein